MSNIPVKNNGQIFDDKKLIGDCTAIADVDLKRNHCPQGYSIQLYICKRCRYFEPLDRPIDFSRAFKGIEEMCKEKWSCYDCNWLTDKCKNKDSENYDKFPQNIEKCNLTRKCDNSLGCSWRKLGDDSL